MTTSYSSSSNHSATELCCSGYGADYGFAIRPSMGRDGPTPFEEPSWGGRGVGGRGTVTLSSA